jgi:hypothetical protein
MKERNYLEFSNLYFFSLSLLLLSSFFALSVLSLSCFVMR